MDNYDKEPINNNKAGNTGGNKMNSGPMDQLPEGYLSDGYFDDKEKKILDSKYIVEYPKELAEELAKSGNTKNSQSQIRKFYESVLGIKTQLDNSGCGKDVNYIKADLNELIPTVYYAQSRDLVTPLFVQFIEKNVNAVHDYNDLCAFIKHFMALIAFKTAVDENKKNSSQKSKGRKNKNNTNYKNSKNK